MYWSDVDDDNDFDVKETRQKKNAKEVIDENDLTSSEEEETRIKMAIKDNTGVINDCDLASSDMEETRQNRNIKADKVADQIIKAFIVKRRKRLIDIDDQNDNISYEESEVRLIFMGITSATLLASISMILTVMALQTYSPKGLQVSLPSTKNVQLKFLSPYVTFMGLGGEGYLFTMKQKPDLSFQYDWELKLPRVPHDTGYFVFKDRNAVFVISSNSNQKMTMINGPNQHVTLAKSHIIDNFYHTGSILRVGNYVMVFGGVKQVQDMYNACTSTTAFWSIKRQHWIQGPALPKKMTDCYSISTGFAVNNTNVVLLFGIGMADDVCIYAYTFSFDALQWNDGKECFIESKNIYGLHPYLTCTTYFDRFSRLKVLILLYEQDLNHMGVGVHIQTLLLDYTSMTVKQLGYPSILKDEFKPPGITTFTLRNQVYLTAFQKSMVEIFEFDENANESFVLKQQMNLKSYLLTNTQFHISATSLWK